MIMFVSQFYNKILWQSDHASVFLVYIYMNQSIPAAVVMIILINNQLDIFSLDFFICSKLPREQGSILYCTTGILLRWLISDP